MSYDFTFEVQNVVGSSSTDPGNNRFSLRNIADKIDALIEVTKGKSALRIKADFDSPSITVYSSGKIIIRSNSKKELEEAGAWLVEQLGDIITDPEKVVDDFSLHNVLGVGRIEGIKGEIQLDSLQEIIQERDLGQAKLEGMQFPPLVFIPNSEERDCTFQIFSSGVIVCVGSDSVKGARDSLEHVIEFIHSTEGEWERDREEVLPLGLAKLVAKQRMKEKQAS